MTPKVKASAQQNPVKAVQKTTQERMVDIIERDNPDLQKMDAWKAMSAEEKADCARTEMEIMVMASWEHDSTKTVELDRLKSKDSEQKLSDEELNVAYHKVRKYQVQLIARFERDNPVEASKCSDRRALYEKAREFMIDEIKNSPKENAAKGGYFKANKDRVEPEYREQGGGRSDYDFAELKISTPYSQRNKEVSRELEREARDIAGEQTQFSGGLRQGEVARSKYLELEYAHFIENAHDSTLLHAYKRSKQKMGVSQEQMRAEREYQEQTNRIRLAEQGTADVLEGKGGWSAGVA